MSIETDSEAVDVDVPEVEDDIVVVDELDNGATLEIENRSNDPPTEYTIHLDPDDEPAECSCPHHQYRHAYCKHMKTAEKYVEEAY